jgi:hypothetical protein
MTSVQTKIEKAIETNKLNLKIIGERKWYSYFIRVTKLVWNRNLYDGYQIDVYNEKYGLHLTTIIL